MIYLENWCLLPVLVMIYDHLKVAPVASFTAKFNLSGYDFLNFTFKLSY